MWLFDKLLPLQAKKSNPTGLKLSGSGSKPVKALAKDGSRLKKVTMI